MGDLTCKNPEILMNGATFVIASWLLIFLIVGITLIVGFPPKPFKRNFKVTFATGLASILLICFILNGQSQAKTKLENGKHDTIVGRIEKISINKNKTYIGVAYQSTIELRLSGVIQSKDGKISKMNPENSKQTIKSTKASNLIAKKLCKGNKCGLKVGDKVKVLANYSNWYDKTTFHSYVPFHIEKCEP